MDSIAREHLTVNTSESSPPQLSPREERQERLKELGLVTSAISSHRAQEVVELRFKAGGVVAKRTTHASPPKAVPRGQVRGLSRKSARRLRERLIGIDWARIVPREGKSKRACLVTLTYPSIYPTNWPEHKAHLKAFLMRLTRRFAVEGVLWRLEYQKREAPHYHLIVVFEADVNVELLKRWASLNWYEVVASGDPNHHKAGTNVKGLHGPTGKLMRYLSKVLKYMSKAEVEAERLTGRCWGCWGRLVEGDELVVALTWPQWVEFTRRLRRWGKRSGYVSSLTANRRGFLVFGEDAATRQLLRGLWSSGWEEVSRAN